MGRDDAMKMLEMACVKNDYVKLFDPSIKDGDIFFNPRLRLVIVGEYIKSENIDAIASLFASNGQLAYAFA